MQSSPDPASVVQRLLDGYNARHVEALPGTYEVSDGLIGSAWVIAGEKTLD